MTHEAAVSGHLILQYQIKHLIIDQAQTPQALKQFYEKNSRLSPRLPPTISPGKFKTAPLKYWKIIYWAESNWFHMIYSHTTIMVAIEKQFSLVFFYARTSL